MGCTYSTAEPDEVLWRCKERRNFMKQLLSCTAELAAAHVAYLRSLRNTGNTLRQLAAVETTITSGTPPRGLQLPPSPPPLPPSPPPLPPSPPPLPNFSPVATAAAIKEKLLGEDLSDSDADDDNFPLPPPPPPPPFLSAAWDSADSLGSPASSASSSPMARRDKRAVVDEDEDEEEEELVEEYEEDKLIQRKEALIVAMNRAREMELADDSLSTISWFTKDTETAATVWRSKKSLLGTAKEIDEHFLKAEAAGKDVTVFLNSEQDCLQSLGSNARKVKRSKSTKVVNVLSWSWSFRSSHSSRDAQDANNGTRPGTHCKTLEKIFAEEQKLYKQVKDEESVKSQRKKVLELLNKLDGGDHDRTKTEKALLDAEELQCRIISLKESINETCLSISRLRDENLFPQLVEFTVGLIKMWRTMFECHEAQSHISQQANLLDNNLGTDPTTDSHRQAISQLEAEVTSWYSSYRNLFKCQQEYFNVLNKWVTLTDCMPENGTLTGSTRSIRGFCEELQRVIDKLPVKDAAQAMEKFLLVIRSIIKQHNEEHSLKKRSDRLQSRLEKELKSLQTLHDGHMFRNPTQDSRPIRELSSTKQGKVEALKKRTEEEKVKYLHSVRTSRAMMLNNLQTSLPNLFEALMEFSSQCVQALEGISTLSGVVPSLPASISPGHQWTYIDF